MNMEGQITSTASQNIYLSDSQTISQVLVKEGDVVNAGDTLMTYDTSMIELDLETQQLQLAQTKLKIQQSEKELEKLKKTKPVSDTPLNPVEPDFPDFPDEPIDPDFPDEPIPTPEPEPTYEDAVLYSSTNKLVFGSKPYKGEGTQEDPYTYLCAPGTVLTGGFLNQMAGYADEMGTKKEEDSEIIRAIRSTKMGGRELLALLDNIQAGNVTFLTAVNNASEEAETEEAIEKDA